MGWVGGVPTGLGMVKEVQTVEAEKTVSLCMVQQNRAIPDNVFCRFWYEYLEIWYLQSARKHNLHDNERLAIWTRE
jgi:hypothetical protein